MSTVAVDPWYGEQVDADELAALIEAGVLTVPEDPEAPGGPRYVDEFDLFDDGSRFQMSRIDALEWELWAGVEQDEAEKIMLEMKAPEWVFLPPGGELAAALEEVRPQTESPMALIELMKATSRLTAWSEAGRLSAIASFYRQRQAQATEFSRPSEIDSHGRPIDPERSWIAEIAAALKLSPNTASSHVDTALRLTSMLTATHTALRCGAITLSKAIAISDATRPLTDAQAKAVEAHVLQRAPSQSHANLLRSLRKQVAHYDAKNEAERHREATAQREVRLVPLPDGMAGLWIVHTAEKIQQMWIVIQAMADLAKRPTTTPAPTTRADSHTDDHTNRDASTSTTTTDHGTVANPDATTDGSTVAEPAATSDDGTVAEPGATSDGSDAVPHSTFSADGEPSGGESMVGSKVGAADFSNEIGLNGSGAATVKPPASPPQEDSAQKNPAPENSSQENSAPDAPAPANSAQRCPATEDSALESLALDGSAQGSPALDNPTLDNPTLDNPTLDNPALDNSAPDRFALEGSVLEGGPWAGADSADVTGVGRPDVGQGRPAVDEGRTAGQRRADMAAELFEIMLWNGLDWLGRRLPDQHRRRPHIEVLIPVGTLLGLDDEPCQLTGYGPIPAEMARRISTDGTWRRLLTDPTNGAVLQASTNRHDPGSLVSETLLAAHSVCDWINCSRPARECDRDHGTPFAQTGTTNLTDLRSYCEFHHVIKDTPAWGWNAANNPDGSTTLTTPTGHRYTTVPPRPGPVTTPSPTDDSPPPF